MTKLFFCHWGLFNFTVGSFGLANMPSIFQQTMELALSDLLGKCIWVFLDVLVIASESPSTHIRDLQAISMLLRNAKLWLKGSKYYFAQTKIQLFGHIITSDGTHSDSEKFHAIVEMPASWMVKLVHSFMGMANYYLKTIPGYAKTTEPLTKLMHKN